MFLKDTLAVLFVACERLSNSQHLFLHLHNLGGGHFAVTLVGDSHHSLCKTYECLTWLMKMTMVFVLPTAPVSLRSACDMRRACRPTKLSPISPSISARGTSAATESTTMTSIVRGDFDTAGSVMFMLRLGELLENWTHKKSVADLAGAMSLNVDRVWLRTDGQELLVPVTNVRQGDRVVVRMGNMIPLDGTVVEGEASVNQSSMTGESLPVRKAPDILFISLHLLLILIEFSKSLISDCKKYELSSRLLLNL